MGESNRDGQHRAVTNLGRVIFTCKINEYEKVYGALKPRELWKKAYPNAV